MIERIAVTGANGFVGRHVAMAARSQGWDVVGFARSEQGARVVAEAGARPVVVSGLEAQQLVPGFGGVRAVVHLAQIGSERGGATYDAVNLAGTRAVVEAARQAGVPCVVFFSGLGVARYGMARRTTNAYFLSKLACEVELYRSGLEVAVFRPSYILGPGGELIAQVVAELAAGEVEVVGDGGYRLQPIGVRDAAAAVLAGVERRGSPMTIDLVGPEPVTYRDFVERLARVARAQGRPADYRIRSVAVEEAERQAAAGGYRGMLRDTLACLLCNEVADPRPLEALLGRFLVPLDDVLAATVRSLPRR